MMEYELPEVNLIRYQYVRNSATPSETLAVTFEGLVNRPDVVFGGKMFASRSMDQLAFSALSESRYQTLAPDTFLEILSRFALADRRRVLFYGYSSGAFAAIYFSKYISCDFVVIALSPNNPLHPWMREYRGDSLKPAILPYNFSDIDDISNAFVFLDRFHPDDRYFESKLRSRYGAAVEVFDVKSSGHGTLEALVESRMIDKVVDLVLNTADEAAKRGAINEVLADVLEFRKLNVRKSYVLSRANNFSSRGRHRAAVAFVSRYSNQFERFGDRRAKLISTFSASLYRCGRLVEALYFQGRNFSDAADNLSVRTLFVELLTEARQYERARALIDSVLVRETKYYLLYYRRALIRLRTNDLKGAYDDATCALDLSGQKPWLAQFRRQLPTLSEPVSVQTDGRMSVLDALELVRSDVPSIAPWSKAPEALRFDLWWVLHGHRQYPHAAAVTDDRRCNAIFAPLEGWECRGGLGVNALMLFLNQNMPEGAPLFELGTPSGQWDLVAWFYLDAMTSRQLVPFLDSGTFAALHASSTGETGPDEPSWLMWLLWRREQSLRDAFDIETGEGRAALCRWFYLQGIEQHGLNSLMLERAVAPPTVSPPVAPLSPFGVNLIGFADGALGIGEDLRMAVQACQAAGVPFKVLNINPGQPLRRADRWLAQHCTDNIAELPHATNIFCLTAFDTLRVYAEKGAALFDGRHNIGWWPWDLPVWPRRWVAAFSLVDEVWAASRFTQTMFAQATDKPVTLMPLPVCVDHLEPASRGMLDLPAERFLFLFVFDFNSYLARKNPQAVVAAFLHAFAANDNGVGLVLKTMNSRPDDPAWAGFQAACGADPRITLIDRTLDRPQLLGLVQACDAYVSLHCAEGFGRTLAEAMLLGKPVVATNFSGNTDFLDSDSGYPVRWTRVPVAVGDDPFITADDAAWWAQPDLADAARQMRAARGVAGSEWVAQLPQQVAERFSPAVIGQRMRAVLQAHCDQALARR